MATVRILSEHAQSNTFHAWLDLIRSDPDGAADAIVRTLEDVPEAVRRACIAGREGEAALRDAFRGARQLARDHELSGIPYMLKDLFDVAGLPTHAGGTFLPEVTGPVAQDSRLKRALDRLGAVMVGKTHLNEFAYGLDGMNAHYGNGTHPWDIDRISGGSSSGSAWAVGRGVTPLAFGTDTGGSVRVPAALCGVYGVRLEPNDLVHDGVCPLSQTFDTAGWFTAAPEDAATFWKALASVDGEVRLSPDEWSGRILYAPREDVLDDPELQRLYQDALPLLAFGPTEEGARKPPRPVDRARHADHANAETSAARPDHASTDLERYLRESSHDHVTAYNVIGSSDAYTVHAPYLTEYADRYEERVHLLIERGAHWPREERERAREIQRSTEEHLRGLLSEYDAIVSPTTHVVAPPFAEAGFDFRRRILALTAPASLARVPVVTVPVFREDGLSGGLQILIHPERPGLGVSLLRHLAAHHP